MLAPTGRSNNMGNASPFSRCGQSGGAGSRGTSKRKLLVTLAVSPRSVNGSASLPGRRSESICFTRRRGREYTNIGKCPAVRRLPGEVLLFGGRAAMIETLRFAGFVAAHAIYCVSQGKSLTVPLLVLEKANGNSQFIQITEGSTEKAVEKAGDMLSQPPEGVVRAVLAFEAYLNFPPGKTDAIFLQACQYQPEPKQMHVAVPFRAASDPNGFAVFR